MQTLLSLVDKYRDQKWGWVRSKNDPDRIRLWHGDDDSVEGLRWSVWLDLIGPERAEYLCACANSIAALLDENAKLKQKLEARLSEEDQCEKCGKKRALVLGRVWCYDGYNYYPTQAFVCAECHHESRAR